MRIQLRNGGTALVDPDDYLKLCKYNWYKMYTGYAYRVKYLGRVNSKPKHTSIFMHREIMNAPKNKKVDHINWDKLDNRKSNLRLCTTKENSIHTKKLSNHNTTGLTGVSRMAKGRKLSKPWRAQITKDGKQIFLGWFSTKDEAKEQYNKALTKLHGKYANIRH